MAFVELIRSNCYPRTNFINILLLPTDISPTNISLYFIYSFYDENESLILPYYKLFILLNYYVLMEKVVVLLYNLQN